MAEEKQEVDPVAAAYGAISIPTGRISNLSWVPSASRAALTGLSRSIAPVLNGIGNKQISRALKHYASEMKEYPQFAVGKYNTVRDGWRRATAAEWKNPTFQAQLVEAHQTQGGWPLLEEPLVCNGTLWVAEGWAMIDKRGVIEVGHIWGPSDPPSSCVVYTLPWTKTPRCRGPRLRPHWVTIGPSFRRGATFADLAE